LVRENRVRSLPQLPNYCPHGLALSQQQNAFIQKNVQMQKRIIAFQKEAFRGGGKTLRLDLFRLTAPGSLDVMRWYLK